MKPRFTKWIPFGNYTWANDTDFIVFARRNLKNGIMQFKTKRVHGIFRNKMPFVPVLIDVKKAWEELIS